MEKSVNKIDLVLAAVGFVLLSAATLGGIHYCMTGINCMTGSDAFASGIFAAVFGMFWVKGAKICWEPFADYFEARLTAYLMGDEKTDRNHQHQAEERQNTGLRVDKLAEVPREQRWHAEVYQNTRLRLMDGKKTGRNNH